MKMLIKSLVSILIVAASFVVVTSQTPDAKKEISEKVTATTGGKQSEKLRDMPFGTTGIDLQFLIKELARDMDLNVLFDSESFRTPGRKVYIDLKNVTNREALDYVLLQEKLISEEVDSKTMIVAARAQGFSVPQIGVGIYPVSDQLAQYFGVEHGILINYVRPEWPAAKAGLKAGDVIVEIDGGPVRGNLGLMGAIDDKNGSEFILKIVRDHKDQTVSLTARKKD